jgi:CsoR family transcriptional regulator, copper-sensing transcriptional repressor
MSKQSPETKEDILKRLRRIEGQVKGIQKMIDEDKHCIDILTQISAARAAINRVGSLVLEKYSLVCIQNAVSNEDKEKSVEELARAMQTFTRFSD